MSNVRVIKYAIARCGDLFAARGAFEVLPDHFTHVAGDTTLHMVRVKHDESVVGGEWDGTDVVITSGAYIGLYPTSFQTTECGGIRRRELNRFSKSTYNHLLNRAGKGLEGYLPVKTWSFAAITATQPDETYLLRPRGGARGQGFIMVEPYTKSLESIGHMLNEAIKATNEPDGLAERFKKRSGLVMSTESTYNEADLLSAVGTGVGDYDLVEYIPDVKDEYRIMTDYLGQPALVVRRVRTPSEAGFEMARGANQDLYLCNPFDQWARDCVFKEPLSAFFAKTNMPLHSFDLFITEDGKWGFFEACCEFGSTSLPNGWLYEQTKLFVVDTATRPLAGSAT